MASVKGLPTNMKVSSNGDSSPFFLSISWSYHAGPFVPRGSRFDMSASYVWSCICITVATPVCNFHWIWGSQRTYGHKVYSIAESLHV